MLKKITLVILLVIFIFSFTSCRSDSAATPENAVRHWMDTWAKGKVEPLLELTSDSFKETARNFYSHEYSRYALLSYSDLKITVLEEGISSAKVQADFSYSLEAPAQTGLQATVTKGAARHIFHLIQSQNRWLIDSIERYPL